MTYTSILEFIKIITTQFTCPDLPPLKIVFQYFLNVKISENNIMETRLTFNFFTWTMKTFIYYTNIS